MLFRHYCITTSVRITRVLSLVVAIATCRSSAPANAQVAQVTKEEAVAIWPQWRGPSRDGFIDQKRQWPGKLGEDHLQQTWRVELGPSYSGPIVASDRVFVTETQKATSEIVRALDRATGKELWQAKWKGAMRVPFFAMANGSWIRATPAYDGDSLFVAGMRDVLVCLDAQTGEERWRVDFVKEFETALPAFGFVSSPLVYGNHVYVQAGSAVRKLNKRTGEAVWETLSDAGGMYGSAFSSPFAGNVAGKEQLLVQTRQKLAGVDLETGEVLWSQAITATRGMNILTPTVYEDSVFTASHGGKSLRLKVRREGESFDVDEAWSENIQGYMSTPVVIEGHVYLHLKNQRFTCLDLETGARKWTTTPFGKYWSMVANGDRILALDEGGELLLIRATPETFELLDRRTVSDNPTWAHLAVCGDELFVRELNAIAAYRWKASE